MKFEKFRGMLNRRGRLSKYHFITQRNVRFLGRVNYQNNVLYFNISLHKTKTFSSFRITLCSLTFTLSEKSDYL